MPQRVRRLASLAFRRRRVTFSCQPAGLSTEDRLLRCGLITSATRQRRRKEIAGKTVAAGQEGLTAPNHQLYITPLTPLGHVAT